MMIYNVTREMLSMALDEVNAHAPNRFDGNIRFKRCDYAGRTREGGERWKVTLTVYSATRRMPRTRSAAQTPRAFARDIADVLTRGTLRGFEVVTAPGARIGPGGRRIAAACWHAHGVFFDALPEYVYPDIGKPLRVRIVTGALVTHPGPRVDRREHRQRRPPAVVQRSVRVR